MKSFSSYIFEKFKITKKTVQNNHYIEDNKSKNDSAGAFASALLLIFSVLLFKVT